MEITVIFRMNVVSIILLIFAAVNSAYYNVTIKDAVTFNVTLHEFKNLTIQMETDEQVVPFAISYPRFITIRNDYGFPINTTLTGVFRKGFDSATFPVEGREVIIETIRLRIYKDMASWGNNSVSTIRPIPFVVKPPPQQFGVTTLIIVFLAFAVNIFGFSLTLEIEHIVSFLKKPIELGVIFIGKFILMPLIALMYGFIFQPDYYMRYVLLAMMAAPSGALTNISCLLLNARLNLNLISLITLPFPAIIMTPFWIKFMGDWLLSYEFPAFEPEVPWGLFMALIFLFSLPGFVAIPLNKYFPKQSYIISIIVRPIAIVVVIICVSLTAYDNWWTMKYGLDYRVTMPPVLILFTGVAISCGAGILITRNFETTKTIMLQTCVPNPGFSLLFLLTVMPQPYGIISICLVGIYYITFLCSIFLYMIVKVIKDECWGDGQRKKNLRKMMEMLRCVTKPKDGVFDEYPTSVLALCNVDEGHHSISLDEVIIDAKVSGSDEERGNSVSTDNSKKVSKRASADDSLPDSRSSKSMEVQAPTRAQAVRRMSAQIFSRVTSTIDDIYLGAIAAEASSKAKNTPFINTQIHGSIIEEVTVEAEEGEDENVDESQYKVVPAITLQLDDEANDRVIIDSIDSGTPSKVQAIRRMSNVVITKAANAVDKIVRRSHTDEMTRNGRKLSAPNNKPFEICFTAQSEYKLDSTNGESESVEPKLPPKRNIDSSEVTNEADIDVDLIRKKADISSGSILETNAETAVVTNANNVPELNSTSEKHGQLTDIPDPDN